MKTTLIGLGLAATIFTSSFLTSTPVLADSFFKDALKLGGAITQRVGEGLEQMGEKKRGTTMGKGLKVGGKIYRGVGKVVEKGAQDFDEKDERD